MARYRGDAVEVLESLEGCLTPAITGGKHRRAKAAFVFDVPVDGIVRHSGERSRMAATGILE